MQLVQEVAEVLVHEALEVQQELEDQEVLKEAVGKQREVRVQMDREQQKEDAIKEECYQRAVE